MQKPTDQQLEAYAAGTLNATACVEIEAWLEQCEDDPFGNLDDQDDQLVDRMRDLQVAEDWTPNDNRQDTATRDGLPPVPPGTTTAVTDWPAGYAPGSQIDQFVLHELIGRGGMGLVFRAYDTVIARDVALKVVSVPRDESSQAVDRFIAETRAVGRVNHPNVISVHSAGTHQDRPWLVMELAPAGSLRDRLFSSLSLPWREATRILCDACSGMAAAHELGLVHRDLKPENLLFSERDAVKVADFGLARALDQKVHSSPNQMPGTPHYMSPEQCCGSKADARSDIYALGATYFELLTGQKPYAGVGGPIAVMSAHVNAPVPDPRTEKPDLPAEVAEIAMRAMAKRPADRFSSCHEMREALGRLVSRASVSDGEGSANDATISQTESVPRPANRRFVVGAAVAAVIPLLIAFFQLPQNSTTASRAEDTGSAVSVDATTVASVEPSSSQSLDRTVAQRVLDLGGLIDVRMPDRSQVIEPPGTLPEEEFELVWIDLSHRDGVDNDLMRQVSRLPELEGLFLRKTGVTDADIGLLENSPLLTAVNLCETDVGDAGITSLSMLPSLRELSVSETLLTNVALQRLQNNTITQLTLNETVVDDDGLQFVSRMHGLELLCIRGTNITDDGLRQLRTLTRLKELNLMGTPISDQGLQWLEHMPGLREVVLSQPGSDRCRITQEGIDRLQSAIPALNVKLMRNGRKVSESKGSGH